ncbi:MAG: phage gp6-like head-tail connector protein [Acidobacterium ailaaui]|jgi:hypothetical protein|nr:phage gp6-like head-tail connector protein [Pseudacidobacterium ailaaui]
MGRAWRVITPVSQEPVSLDPLRAYLRVDFSDDDALLQQLITRARVLGEELTHRAFATQQVECIYTIDRPPGGEMYGPIQPGPNWYQYQEQLGANPFGAAMFYFDLPCPPFQEWQPYSVETRVTVWDPWMPFTGPMTIDTTVEPARMYFQVPVTANQWRFRFWCGYSAQYPLPAVLEQALYEAVAYWYQNREAQDLPEALQHKFLLKRVDWL